MRSDPLHVLSTTDYVVKHSQSVFINKDKISSILPEISRQFDLGLDSAETGFGASGIFEQDAQLLFIQDAVNFCFWAKKDQPKWQIEFPQGNIINGGNYAMASSFKRALSEKIPVLDAKYLAKLTPRQINHLFRSCNQVQIPLIEKRLENLKQAGEVLLKKFDGQFINVIKQADYDAATLVKLIYKNFSSFRDIARYQGKTIYFLKRAQLCAHDISYLKPAPQKIRNLEKLTAFADYKLPQILREFGIIEYALDLAETIDNQVLIKKGSRQETEIRAATVWAIELIKKQLPNRTAAQIDNAIWLLSQKQPNPRPYHRTYSIYY